MRRQVQHALVEQIDDHAILSGRQLLGEILRQLEGRPQIGLHMVVPALARRGQGFVALEDRGVVDQDCQRATQVCRCTGNKSCDGCFVQQISLKRHRLAAQGSDGRHSLCRFML
jgi:hypothetical protein